MAKRCRSCCTPPACPVQVRTNVCNPGGGAALGKDGVTVVLKDGGGTTVGTATSSGQVGPISLGAHGTGYTSAPTVVISAPGGGGVQATAVATISGGSVSSVTLTDPGSGYTGAITIGFSGGGGTGATATAALVHGARLTAPGTATYTATASLSGYRDGTATVTVTNCAVPTTATVTLDTTIAGWPVTPLSGTDSVFGTFALTNAGSYTVTKTWSGTVIQSNCGTPDPGAGSFDLTYQLVYSTCGIQLKLSWDSCSSTCALFNAGFVGGSITGTPPRSRTFPGPAPTCGGAACSTLMTLAATTVQSGPLLLVFTIPAMTPACLGAPWPYPSGGTITLTP